MPSTAFHYTLSELTWNGDNEWFHGSRVLVCNDPVASPPATRTAIIFLHGWGGSASETWEAFPHSLRGMSHTAHADVFFLQYPSRSRSAAVCGSKFAEFLRDVLWSSAERVINPSLPASAPPRGPSMYERIVIVAHSMGAAVARRGLLDLDRDELTDEQRRRFRMLFFAPAHKGSSLPLLIRSGMHLDWLPGSALVGAALTTYYRSLHDLAEDSNFLKTLEADSKEARGARAVFQSTPAAAAQSTHYLRARVYHADGDKVVSQDRFDDDLRPPGTITHRNHRSICKPSERYQDPVTALASLLQQLAGVP
jgi:pimeloyl-ACP methyl ester carboxylesterase